MAYNLFHCLLNTLLNLYEVDMDCFDGVVKASARVANQDSIPCSTNIFTNCVKRYALKILRYIKPHKRYRVIYSVVVKRFVFSNARHINNELIMSLPSAYSRKFPTGVNLFIQVLIRTTRVQNAHEYCMTNP